MGYCLEGSTKRFNGNSSCDFKDFSPIGSEKYQYGCEFEFHIELSGNPDLDR